MINFSVKCVLSSVGGLQITELLHHLDKFLSNLLSFVIIMPYYRATLISGSDITSSMRGTISRMKDHLFTTLFALMLIIMFMAAITGVIIFIFTEDTPVSDLVTHSDFFLMIYFIVAGRAISNSLKLIYKDPTTELLRIIPISTRIIYKGKFFSILLLNLITFSIFYSGFLFFFLLIYPDPISLPSFASYTAYIYLIGFFGTMTGFLIPMIYYLPWDHKKRTLSFLVPCILAGAMIINISELEGSIFSFPKSTVFPGILGFFSLLLFGIILGMSWYFNEAIHSYLPSHTITVSDEYHVPRLVTFTKWFGFSFRTGRDMISHSRIVAAKESLSTLRDSYFHIYAGMTAILTFIGIMMVQTFPQEILDSEWGWLVYPIMVSFMLYIEGSFMVTLGSISLIGKEGKRLWILRSLPVSGYEVLNGKALSVIIPSIVGGFIMVIPLLYLTELPAGQNFIFLVLTLCIILSFSGIGIIAGTKYPNFTEGARGSPDIVFQMFILFICLMLLGFIIIPPMTFYYNYGTTPGLAVALLVLVFCYAVFINGVRMGESIFDRLSAEEYEG